MPDNTSFFNSLKLPSANPQEALETISRNHFRPLFDPTRFEVRSEDYRDKGVDFEIEVIEDTGLKRVYTNFRFLIQLKATDTITSNSDGSISIQIETSNINYLLNHPMPAYYVLYHNPSGKFYYENLRDYTSGLSIKDENWKGQATHALRFSRVLDKLAVEDMHHQTVQKGIMQRQLDEQMAILGESQYPDDKITLDRDLNIISDAEIRTLIEKGGFFLINKDRWADVLQFHKKASGSMETSGLYNLVIGVASYHSGNMPDALSFLKAARKKDASMQPGLEHFLTYFETASKYAMGIYNEKQYSEKMILCSNSPALACYIALEKARKEYIENCNLDSAMKIYEGKVRQVILDNECPTGLKFSASLELLQYDGENINIEYIRNISRINGLGLNNSNVLHKAYDFLNWFHNAYQEWLGKIREIMEFCKEDIGNTFLFHLASITRTRMNYHLLVISREIFLVEEHPQLPRLEFKEGDQPFRNLLEETSEAANYFNGISHVENLMVCLSLQYEIAHYIGDKEIFEKAMRKMEELADRYELNVINTAVQKLKSDGPYHETFIRAFDFEGHAQLKQMHNQRKELKLMDTNEAAIEGKMQKGRASIMLYPMGIFSFPMVQKEIVYEILCISAEARQVFDNMLDSGIQPVANINYNPIVNEGYVHSIPRQQTSDSWENMYRIRKRFYEEAFYRLQ
jgi:hypothetical protein